MPHVVTKGSSKALRDEVVVGVGLHQRAHRALPLLLLLYCAASLLHFAHNAEYLADYPNLPGWLSRGHVYASWGVILIIGACGYLLFRRGRPLTGLMLLAIYTALGLDGLLHYGRAPISSHTFGMNLTIWTEVVAAAMALAAVLWIAVSHVLQRSRATTR